MPPKHKPTIEIKKAVLRKKLNDAAVSQGYENAYTMLYELYVVDRVSLYKLADKLVVPVLQLRTHLKDLGIRMRPRGGPNNKIIEITPEIIEEVSRHGIKAVSARLGAQDATFRQRLREWARKQREETE